MGNREEHDDEILENSAISGGNGGFARLLFPPYGL
jgi:hypothetical protein